MQVLVYHQCIRQSPSLHFTYLQMILLAISTTLIAAGGYIINDYFDVKIDEINKPNRVTVELQFKRRHIMFAQIVCNSIAILIVLPMALQAGHISLIGVQIFSILFLVLYSFYFKRKAFIGNCIVALLTALSVLTPAFYEYSVLQLPMRELLFGLSFFAFLLTLIREIVKDLEDIKGDEADGCKTMPILYGINYCKSVLYILSSIFILYCIFILCNTYTYIQWPIFCIGLGTTCIGIIYFCIKLVSANSHDSFKFLSRLLKIITFIGILQIYFI
jgi:4-hydroxybenzoate polyprenyltransferase